MLKLYGPLPRFMKTKQLNKYYLWITDEITLATKTAGFYNWYIASLEISGNQNVGKI